MSEYEWRICIKCGRAFQEHYLGPHRPICNRCFYRKGQKPTEVKDG